jgi:four helix bundle protein
MGQTDASRPRRYDLEERTAKFGEAVILFAKQVPFNAVNRPLVDQLVRSGTSIGANYCEADDAETKPDFRHKIGLCRKEARETKYWLRMVARAEPSLSQPARELWREAKELHLIFAAIFCGRTRKSANGQNSHPSPPAP